MSRSAPAPTLDQLGDVRIFLTPEGAAYLTKRRARPTCWTEGCPNTPEPGEEACERHANADVF